VSFNLMYAAKTCGLIWALQLNLGIKFLRKSRVDWAADECTADLYSYKTSAKPGDACSLICISDSTDQPGMLDTASMAQTVPAQRSRFAQRFRSLAHILRAQAATKNIAV
jgi:hypothetical protein